jgi:hypothetical protein
MPYTFEDFRKTHGLPVQLPGGPQQAFLFPDGASAGPGSKLANPPQDPTGLLYAVRLYNQTLLDQVNEDLAALVSIARANASGGLYTASNWMFPEVGRDWRARLYSPPHGLPPLCQTSIGERLDVRRLIQTLHDLAGNAQAMIETCNIKIQRGQGGFTYEEGARSINPCPACYRPQPQPTQTTNKT